MFYTAWFAWAFLCAWAIRIAIVAILRKRLGGWSYFAAYGVWIALLALGLLAVELTGYAIYGPDPSNPWQRAGEFVVVWSPIGLPLLIGAPAVLLLDAIVVAVGMQRAR